MQRFFTVAAALMLVVSPAAANDCPTAETKMDAIEVFITEDHPDAVIVIYLTDDPAVGHYRI